MKIQIRQGCFETNSSSVHAICIADIVSNEFFNKVKEYGIYTFCFSEYGWEQEDRYDVADYLYTLSGGSDEFKKKAEEYLESEGILAEFTEPSIRYFGTGYSYEDFGFVDHGFEANEFYEWALESKENFFRCIFGCSYIVTGNDNDDSAEIVENEYEQCSYKNKFIKSN